MTAPSPSIVWHRLSVAMLSVMGAGSIEGVLAEAVRWMAGLGEADTAAAFTSDGDRILEEGWFPRAPGRGEAIGDRLRWLALESARTGSPFECTPTDLSADTIRILPLQAGEQSIGAVALVQRGTPEIKPSVEAKLELIVRFAVEAIVQRRRIAELRAASDQQKRWFDQLDQQVRVLDRERQKFAAVVNQSDTYAFVVDPSRTIRW